MKKLTISLLLLVALSYAQGIAFRKISFDEAQKAAKVEGKIIFIDFMAEWCRPCKELEKYEFSQKVVGDYWNAHFVSIQVDIDKLKEEGLKATFGISVMMVPTLLFASSSGEILYVNNGYTKAEELLKMAQLAQDPERQLPALSAVYQTGNATLEQHANYCMQLLAIPDSVAWATRQALIARLTEDQYFEDPYHHILYEQYGTSVEAPYFTYFLDNFAQFTEKHGEEMADDLLRFHVLNRYYAAEHRNDTAEIQKMTQLYIRAKGQVGFDNFLRLRELGYAIYKKEWDTAFVLLQHIEETSERQDAESRNDLAWSIFENSKDITLLNKALQLMESCTSCAEDYHYLDTHAALLYKLGRKPEGKVMAEKAIAKAKTIGISYEATEKLMKKYK